MAFIRLWRLFRSSLSYLSNLFTIQSSIQPSRVLNLPTRAPLPDPWARSRLQRSAQVLNLPTGALLQEYLNQTRSQSPLLSHSRMRPPTRLLPIEQRAALFGDVREEPDPEESVLDADITEKDMPAVRILRALAKGNVVQS